MNEKLHARIGLSAQCLQYIHLEYCWLAVWKVPQEIQFWHCLTWTSSVL